MELKLLASDLEETTTIKNLIENETIVSPKPLCRLLSKGLTLEYADEKWVLHLPSVSVRYFKNQSDERTQFVFNAFHTIFEKLVETRMIEEKGKANNAISQDFSTNNISTYTKLSALDRIIDIIAIDRENIKQTMTFDCLRLESIVMNHATDKTLSFVPETIDNSDVVEKNK